ncbi:hypothetical protein D3C73_1424380 [compost metagenome]
MCSSWLALFRRETTRATAGLTTGCRRALAAFRAPRRSAMIAFRCGRIRCSASSLAMNLIKAA